MMTEELIKLFCCRKAVARNKNLWKQFSDDRNPKIPGFLPLAAPWRTRGFSQLVASKKGVPRDMGTPNSSNEIDTVLRGKVDRKSVV